MDRDQAISELRRVKRQRERAETARKDAAKATREAIIAALKAEIGPSEIASECGVTDSHVRAVRREAKLPANPSYAHLEPPARVKKNAEAAPQPAPTIQTSPPEPQQLHGSRKPRLTPRVERLSPSQAIRRAALAEAHADAGWAARVIAEYPGLSANWHPYVVVEAGLARGFIEDSELPD